ncbi:hypothetical protein VB715_16150 [Crocosphaera sp. UHCC 0190]|uniref:hypothetical protein n=1 Tax=Crocosphaera sp. UHCC 0190 TaxID=3110246 RepID=UPI002B20181C|nr:hypothetical protein [Crocosphaera sp. UHCC 0190]MEA5511306.1 hypothetical protein [Crocosphaera sp. UHCC 0190]
MLYRPLKLTIIAATVFVWMRLLLGTAAVINDPNQSFIDHQTIASQTTQIR